MWNVKMCGAIDTSMMLEISFFAVVFMYKLEREVENTNAAQF